MSACVLQTWRCKYLPHTMHRTHSRKGSSKGLPWARDYPAKTPTAGSLHHTAPYSAPYSFSFNSRINTAAHTDWQRHMGLDCMGTTACGSNNKHGSVPSTRHHQSCPTRSDQARYAASIRHHTLTQPGGATLVHTYAYLIRLVHMRLLSCRSANAKRAHAHRRNMQVHERTDNPSGLKEAQGYL